MGFIKGIFNAVADPRLFFILAVVLRSSLLVWKRELIASNAVGYGLLGVPGASSSSSAPSTPTSG